MRRCTCPVHRGRCYCGRVSADRSAAQHAAAGAVIAVLFALGGTVRLLMWSLPHPSRLWAPALLTVLVAGMIMIRNRPFR